jgi:hypothetical protein
MSERDIKSAITFIKKGKDTQKLSEPVRYNSEGVNDSKLKRKFSDEETAAITTSTTTGQLFRVKIERNGKFYNPTKYGYDYNLSQKDRITKDLRFQFKTVSEKSFGHYIKFLADRYESSLLAAEREV